MGPSKQLKQIIPIEHDIVKNPDLPEANQLSVYKRGWGFELGASVKQIHVVVRATLEAGSAGLWAKHVDQMVTLPPLSSLRISR